MKRDKPFNTGRVAAAKGMAFSKSPVLAVRLPDWRSRVMLFLLFAGFATLALARGVKVARATLRFEPMTVIGFGILAALLSGLPGLWLDGSFLTHQWLVLGNFHLGTTLLFDIGVYLVVLGGILSLILRFYEDL